MNMQRRQSGYMAEIPIIMLAAAMVVAIAVPRLPVMFGKGLVIAGTLVWIGGLYYMILVPGWMPGNQAVKRRAWKWILFLLLAGFLFLGALAYVMNAGSAAS